MFTKMKQDIKVEIEVPEGVEVRIEDKVIVVKGEKGEIRRELRHPEIELKKEGSKISLTAKKATKKEKMITGTFKAHINNMLRGVREPYRYTLKICSSHFPMNVNVEGNKLIVKNFLGEKQPRTIKLHEGADVKIEGENIIVESSDIEKAGMTASRVEQVTRITNKARTKFQDGIFIIKKP